MNGKNKHQNDLDYDTYLEDQLNELNYKHQTLSNNHIKLTKEHKLLLDQYDRLQQDLTDMKLNQNIPKSKSLGHLDRVSSEYLSSAEMSPILNIESILTKIERSKFKPVQNFEKDYEFSLEMIKKVKEELIRDKNELYNDLLLILLDVQAESNLYHYKYAQMIQDKDIAFRKTYYTLSDNMTTMKILSPPTISSNPSSVKTFKSTVFKAITRLGSSVADLVSLTQESDPPDSK